MALPQFLKEDTKTVLRKLEKALVRNNPSIDLSTFKRMPIDRLNEQLASLDKKRTRLISESSYGQWLNNPEYIEVMLLKEAIDTIIDYKKLLESKEVLVPGYTYYRKVNRFGSFVSGQKCLYLGENKFLDWVPFKEHVAVMKAKEILLHGNADDFQKIYVECANGHINPFDDVDFNHVAKSTTDALRLIEGYCDNRWEGSWPWEKSSPTKLRRKIEERKQMNERAKLELRRMHYSLSESLKRLSEGEMEKFEVITLVNDISSQIDGMIGDLGKISSDGIEAVASARSTHGESAASALQQALQEPVNSAAQALSSLKSAIDQAVETMKSGGDAGDEFSADWASPEDAMGDEPEMGMDDLDGDDDVSDQLADMDLEGQSDERLKKEM